MADPNLTDFYARLARFEKMHRKGYSFDAPGTLTRPRAKTRRSLSMTIFKPLVLVAAFAIGMKSVIYNQVGTEDYNLRVAGMGQGEGFDRLGGWLMQADGATIYFSGKIDAVLAYFTE